MGRDVMLSMEITRLIERCRQGDADALGELYKAYAQRMRGVCRRYVKDEQTVEDVLHDAFVIIFTSFDRLREDAKAEAWMMAITRNVASKCKDHLTAFPTVPLDETNEAGMTAEEHEEKEVKGVPLSEVVRMIDRLPEGYGKVFRLSVFEGLSHKEIAAMLGIEPHSSSSQLARAKKMLRKMMRQYWAAVLLLLLMPLSFFLFRRVVTTPEEEKSIVGIQKESPKDTSTEPFDQSPLVTEGQHEDKLLGIKNQEVEKPMIVKQSATFISDKQPSAIALSVDSVTSDTIYNIVAQDQTNADSIAADTSETVRKLEILQFDIADLLPKQPATGTRRQQKWSVDFAYVEGLGDQSYNRPYGFTEMPQLVITGEPPSPVTFENWSDYAAFLAEYPDVGSSRSRSVVMHGQDHPQEPPLYARQRLFGAEVSTESSLRTGDRAELQPPAF